MLKSRLTLSQPHYDPEHGLYEAYARIIEQERAYIFRVQVPSPPHAEFGFITRALKQRARAVRPGPPDQRGARVHHKARMADAPPARPVEALPRQIGSLLAA